VAENTDRSEGPNQPAQRLRLHSAGGRQVSDGLRAVVELRGDVELRDNIQRLGELEPADELDHLHRRRKFAGGLLRSIASRGGIGHVKPSTLDPNQIPALREIARLCILGIGAHDPVGFVRMGVNPAKRNAHQGVEPLIVSNEVAVSQR
jgi:hypothetical protein